MKLFKKKSKQEPVIDPRLEYKQVDRIRPKYKQVDRIKPEYKQIPIKEPH